MSTNTLNNKTPEAIYLEWLNEWLTVERMAEYYQVSPELLFELIQCGKMKHRKQYEIA